MRTPGAQKKNQNIATLVAQKEQMLPHSWAECKSSFLNTMKYVCTFRKQPDGFLHRSNKALMHLDEKLSLQPGNNARATTLISILLLTCTRQWNSYIKIIPNLIFVHLKSLPQMKYFGLFHVIQYCRKVWGWFFFFAICINYVCKSCFQSKSLKFFFNQRIRKKDAFWPELCTEFDPICK